MRITSEIAGRISGIEEHTVPIEERLCCSGYAAMHIENALGFIENICI